jgi:hypothetical protein
LDYNKVALREKLIQQHQLSLVSKTEQSQVYNKNKKINNTKSLDAANKNKDVNKFMESVQQKSFKQEYLDKKELINA